jgi:hypothetical protein
MSIEGLFAPTTCEAPSAPMRETFIAPTVLAACCVCRLIRDEAGSTPDRERWVTPRTYRTTYGVNPAELALTHTYCLKCFKQFTDTVKQFFRETGTSP